MKADFNFIPARNWAEWNTPVITFFGASGHYLEMKFDAADEGTKYIIWDGQHVATKHLGSVVFNPNHTDLPKGFKQACKSI